MSTVKRLSTTLANAQTLTGIANRANHLAHHYRPRRFMGRWKGARVLLASPPKSGTNLLLRILTDFPQLRYGGDAVGPPSERPNLLRQVAQIQKGEFVVTHLDWGPDLETVVNSGVKVAFILRDPRATCVSHYHHIMREPSHWCHTYFHHTLRTPSERLLAAITGLDLAMPDGERLYLPSIDEHFRTRLGYRDSPQSCTVTFEELIGPAGGGSRTSQISTIYRLAEHLEADLSATDVQRIAEGAFSTKAATFRRGEVDSWREEMQEIHKTAFKRVAGQLLIDLDYETDFRW